MTKYYVFGGAFTVFGLIGLALVFSVSAVVAFVVVGGLLSVKR